VCRSCWQATNRSRCRPSTPKASQCGRGHHCAQRSSETGPRGHGRPSFAFYNTFDEIDVFIDAVRRIAEGSAK